MWLLALLPGCTGPGTKPDGRDTEPEPEDTRGPPLASAGVVVVGAGAAGLSAAVAALESGADVLVLERESHAGGGGEFAANLWGAGTTWQAAMGVVDSPELALAEWTDFTGGEAPTSWVDAYVRGSAETLTWLADHGAVFADRVVLMDKTGSVGRIHQLEAPVVTRLADEVADVTELDTAVTGLVVDPDGRVVGVEVDGGWVEAGAVVLATGGFAREPDRVNASRPDVAAFHWYMEAWPGMTGAGQDMVDAIGVTLAHPERIGLFSHAVEDPLKGYPEVMTPDTWADGVLIDATGARAPHGRDGSLVDDEALVETHLARGPLSVVLDSAQLAPRQFSGRGFNYEGPDAGNLDAAAYVAAAGLPAYDSIAALAAGIGVDADTLEAAVIDWNAAVDTQRDATYGEPMEGRTRVDEPPYYALPMVLSAQKSFGGAPLDDSAHVLMPDGTPVPGLYAAGEMAGFLGGADLGHGWNGSVSACYFVGRAAGSAAAAEVAAAR